MMLAPVWIYVEAADCPTIVKTALDATNNVCSSTGRNQACYGNINLTALPQAGVSAFTFTKPGIYHYDCSIHPNMTGTVTVN